MSEACASFSSWPFLLVVPCSLQRGEPLQRHLRWCMRTVQTYTYLRQLVRGLRASCEEGCTSMPEVSVTHAPSRRMEKKPLHTQPDTVVACVFPTRSRRHALLEREASRQHRQISSYT